MRKLLVSLILMLVAAVSSAASDKRVHKTVSLDPNGSVSIDTHNGSIVVTTWNQPTVDVTARIEPGEFGSDDSVQKTEVKVTGTGSRVRIESDYTGVSMTWKWF